MKLQTGLLTALAFGWLTLGLVSTSQAGLTLKYNPANLIKTGSVPLTAEVDVLVSWDGLDSNTFSGLDFDIVTPAGVTVRDNATPSNPLGFQLATVVLGSASFVSFGGNVAPFVVGVDKTLTTLSFDVAAEGVFPISMNVTYAQSGAAGVGPGIQDITNQFSSVPADLVVAVPEPSSFALMGVVSLAGFGWRRRRS